MVDAKGNLYFIDLGIVYVFSYEDQAVLGDHQYNSPDKGLMVTFYIDDTIQLGDKLVRLNDEELF